MKTDRDAAKPDLRNLEPRTRNLEPDRHVRRFRRWPQMKTRGVSRRASRGRGGRGEENGTTDAHG